MLRLTNYRLYALCIMICMFHTMCAQEYKATENVADASIVTVGDSATVMHGDFKRHLYVKTNAVAWLLLITNAEVEIDLGKHLTADMSIHCSAWNYFSDRCKYRVLSVYPGIRYWLDASNNGAFVGIHAGIASYNMSMNGDYRIQDHDGNSPAIGGGISAGYRMSISRNRRWMAEVCLGAGVYDLHYDKFYNENNGLRASTVKKTGICLDHASLSLCYVFDLKK